MAVRTKNRAKKPAAAKRAVARKRAQPLRAFVATRKGLFTFRRAGLGWKAGEPAFLGEPVSAVLSDARTGRLYAAPLGCQLSARMIAA